MKKITVTLTDAAEKVFNEIMYALPREEDGTGMCTQDQAICHALEKMWAMEQAEESVTSLRSGGVSGHGNYIAMLGDVMIQLKKAWDDGFSQGMINDGYEGDFKDWYEKHEAQIRAILPHPTPENSDEFGPVDLTDVEPDKISKGAKPISEWISVDDRLPEKEPDNPFESSRIVQARDVDGEFYGAFYSQRDKVWYEGFSEVELPNKITHWHEISPINQRT